MSKYQVPPKADATEGGCKVGWSFYRDENVAKKAAEVAKHNAMLDSARGYDFGFQTPGSRELMSTGPHAGLWRVCFS